MAGSKKIDDTPWIMTSARREQRAASVVWLIYGRGFHNLYSTLAKLAWFARVFSNLAPPLHSAFPPSESAIGAVIGLRQNVVIEPSVVHFY